MKLVDYVASAVFLVGMVVLYYISTSHWDIWVLLLVGSIIGMLLMTWIREIQKYESLDDEMEGLKE